MEILLTLIFVVIFVCCTCKLLGIGSKYAIAMSIIIDLLFLIAMLYYIGFENVWLALQKACRDFVQWFIEQ